MILMLFGSFQPQPTTTHRMGFNRSVWGHRVRRAFLLFPDKEQGKRFYMWRLQRSGKALPITFGIVGLFTIITGVVAQILVPGNVNVIGVVRSLVSSILCFVAVWVFRVPEKGPQRPGDIRMLLALMVLGNQIASRVMQMKDNIDVIKEGLLSCVMLEDVCEALQPLVDDGFVESPSIEALLMESVHARFASFIFLTVVPLVIIATVVGLAFWEFLVVEVCWYIAVRVGISMIDFDSGPGQDVFQLQVMSLHLALVTFAVLVYKQEVMLRSEFGYSQHLENRNKSLERELRVAKNKAHQNVQATEAEHHAVMTVFSKHRIPKLKRLEIKFDTMELQERIGSGSMGEIIRARYTREGTGETLSVALKRIRRGNVKVKTLNKFVGEMLMMAKLKHPNVVAFYGACWDNPANVCLVMELMARGSLNDVLADNTLTEVTWPNLKLKFALEVARGMNYLHSRQPPIMHRDLKGDNVLVSEYFVSKLTDFGLSRTRDDLTMTQGTGTPLWTAPEVLAGGYYNEACDVYSFAILLVELATHELPFLSDLKADPSLENRLLHMIRFEGERPRLPPDLPRGLAGLIKLCWRHESGERPKFSSVVRKLEQISVDLTDGGGSEVSSMASSVNVELMSPALGGGGGARVGSVRGGASSISSGGSPATSQGGRGDGREGLSSPSGSGRMKGWGRRRGLGRAEVIPGGLIPEGGGVEESKKDDDDNSSLPPAPQQQQRRRRAMSDEGKSSPPMTTEQNGGGGGGGGGGDDGRSGRGGDKKKRFSRGVMVVDVESGKIGHIGSGDAIMSMKRGRTKENGGGGGGGGGGSGGSKKKLSRGVMVVNVGSGELGRSSAVSGGSPVPSPAAEQQIDEQHPLAQSVSRLASGVVGKLEN